MNERGMSLMEMVIVMALVALVTGLAGAGLLAATTRFQGRVVATELAKELRAARYLAITRRERIRVVLTPGASMVRIESADQPGRTFRAFDFRDKGVVVEHLSNSADLLFHPSGRAATPVTITLVNRQLERWRITVSLIGRVTQS
jgi:prepilin-type N-terminal cleavage/methylation domain-containing protein